MTETFEEQVERIARAYFDQPCPPGDSCNPELHDWDFANPEDKQYHRNTVIFILQEAGVG
ncbi:MAG TPA: hypothetical protein VF867_17855 [Arthrobacter sp.]